MGSAGRSRRHERGQAVIFTTLTITVMLGLIGTVVDFGWAHWRKVACQTAASSAATAAIVAASAATNQSCGSGTSYWNCTSSYSCPSNPSTISSNLDNGCLYAKSNGFLNTGRQTVVLQAGTGAPPTASGATPAYYVIATVTESIPSLFSAALGQPWMKVAGQATAGVFIGGGGGCVYVLDPSGSGAWTQSGGNFTTGCGIYVNSNSPSALSMSGGNITLSGGSDLNIVGNKSQTGGNIDFSGGGSLNTGASSPGNPISGLTAPTPSLPCTPDPGTYNGTINNATIPSGTYCSLHVSGGTGLVLSGTYIFTTGSFTVTGGNITTAAGGATVYFPASNSGNLSVTGGNMTLTAPSSGTLSGMALWKDGVSTNITSATFTGGNLTLSGIIYMPYTKLTYTGGNTPVQQSIVVYDLTMTGGNISQPATSGFFSNGAGINGNYIVQ